MTDLLFDASAAVMAFRTGSSLGKLAEQVRGDGGRLWLYAGEFTNICRLLSSNAIGGKVVSMWAYFGIFCRRILHGIDSLI